MASLIIMLFKMLAGHNKANALSAPAVPSGWTAQLDPSVNKYYYIETATSKTQWDPPQGTVMPAPNGEKKPDYMKMAKSYKKKSAFPDTFRFIHPDLLFHRSLSHSYISSVTKLIYGHSFTC